MDSLAASNIHSVSPDANIRLSGPSVVLVGTSFRTAKIDERERIAKRLREIPGSGTRVGNGRIIESSVLETCNRLEIYIACISPNEVIRWMMARLCVDGATSARFYARTGLDAIRHIFRVASGLDSPVLGEEQILQQVKDSGKMARASGQAKSILSSLFDAAYTSGKRIHGSYVASSANRSLSAFALRRALKELGHSPAKVLLIGSGETAKLAAVRLKGSTVYLLSGRRNVEARFPNAKRVSRRKLREVAKNCDLIIAATRHNGYVLTKRDLPENERGRMVILDLGFPRNVDPSLRDAKWVSLYDLDAVADWARADRRRENSSAEKMVEEETRRFNAWLKATRLTPTLANVYKWAERVREEETLAALRKLPQLSSHDRTIIEALSKRLTGKLLSPHANFVKKVGRGEDQSERLLLLDSIFRDGSG